MKYIAFFLLVLSVTSCSPAMRQAITPNHMGITPSCEWEIQEGCKPKHKPKISTTLDWNF